MIKNRIIAWVTILTLPLAVWGIVAWTTRHTHPWFVVAVALGVLILLAVGLYASMPGWYQRYRDARIAVASIAFLMILPAVALLSGLNLLGKQVSRVEVWELSESYNRGPSDGVYLFLWTGNELHKERVTVADPLARAVPGDQIRLDYRRGLLGFEYLHHADIAR
jgi:hypothetical protein